MQGTSEELHNARLGYGNLYYYTYDLETLTLWYEEYDEVNSLVDVKEPEGSDNYTEVTYDKEQSLSDHSTAPVTPPAYTPSILFLATMEPLDTFLIGDEVISTIPERENDELIKSSVDDLVPILRESELTLDNIDLEYSMPIDPPLPCTDVLGDTIVDIDLPFGKHLDTFLTGDWEIDFNPRDIETSDLIPVPRVFDEPLGNFDSVPRSYDVTFSNPLFDINDDYTLCYDNLLFDKEFEDISSLDPPESTLVIDESSLLVTPPPVSKQLSLREVERFDPFFSLTQSGEETRVMETPSLGFHHMPSHRHAAYSPKELTMEPLDTLLIGDEVISTTPERENDEFIKSSDDDLVPIPREYELTLVSIDLECSMPIDPPLPCTDVLGDTIVDIDLPFGKHLDTFSTGDREIDFNHRDIETKVIIHFQGCLIEPLGNLIGA
ncbi:hypothetical protein Tco_0858811 [Tanacetum coccineum]|uniref:Uncharacterized protein n=1 Tax=Tanacetum coccineum TaxID=301880 RepID=A0ABQ5BFX3_9ASTR